ncbi:MAG TPA: plastocyanin/azurin family copper-binding protein [Candidatus Limnocylindrales bacterium]|jgi:plastocyanin
MTRRTSLAIALVGMLGLLVLAGPVSAAGRGVKMGEANERYFFAPQTQYANVGDTVTWTNGTDVAHTVTSDSGSELASDSIGDGATFEHTFSAEGTFTYHCTIHPYMTGKITVLAAGAALPATDASGPSRSSDPDGSGPLVVLLAGLAGVVAAGFAIRRSRPADEA